jgi:hypothetical protein
LDNQYNHNVIDNVIKCETLHYSKDYTPTFNDLVRLGSERFLRPSEPQTPLHEFGLHRLPKAPQNGTNGNVGEITRDSRPYILSLCEVPLNSNYFALIEEAPYDPKTGEVDLIISRSTCNELCYIVCVACGGAK